MKLKDLAAAIPVAGMLGNRETEITDIVTSTSLVREGCCFICVKGFRTDGHAFAAEAAEKGASAIVMDNENFYRDFAEKHKAALKAGTLALILTDSSRHAVAMLSDKFWGHPSGELRLTGVTGTKGKTTTSLMIKKIMDTAGRRTGLVGTMYNMIGREIIPTERTTPEANVLQPLLRKMADSGVSDCVMEVSSQGLKLERVGGCVYGTCVFTNLSRDHIGETEHPDMEDYAASKAKLFRMCENGVFNADSDWFERISRDASCRIYTYGIDRDADFRAEDIVYGSDCVDYELCWPLGRFHVHVRIPGKFSVYNSLAAAAVCILEGITPETVAEGLKDIVVKGKAEIVPTGRDFTVMIDYAHNPDSFINIITTAKAFAKRVVFLFGAGGDRNRPRALMGETVASYADFTIITSDNPRTEDPAKIVADIEEGARKTGRPYICIVDRKQAICYAIGNARPGDVIILAGKGHETTQILKDRVIPFDEREVVREALRALDK
ncbi:MAG: UDP-N-acetylmuramoyl-L-alanyl-D-glutamate--2,6-diaminopimelate ligase [Clostridia bacterium]|nr:UDP-N-acetylmuramoyl-L-alanyl-D-glutamate--2,6-diaminopimelate ligase [Clostridia bacterium]